MPARTLLGLLPVAAIGLGVAFLATGPRQQPTAPAAVTPSPEVPPAVAQLPAPPPEPAPAPRRPLAGLPHFPDPLPLKPPPVEKEAEVRLPGGVDRVVVGGGGRFLVLRLADNPHLAAFDVCEGRIAWVVKGLPELKLPVAAGMNHVVVALPNDDRIRRYDLLTGAKEADEPFPAAGVTALAMGHASAGPLAVADAEGVRLYDPIRFEELRLPAERVGPRHTLWRTDAEPARLRLPAGLVRVSGDGRTLFTSEGARPGLSSTLVHLGRDHAYCDAPRIGSWYIQPGPDGRHLHVAGLEPCRVTLPDGRGLASFDPFGGGGALPGAFVPACHDPFYLELTPDEHVPWGGHAPGEGRGDPAGRLRVHLRGGVRPLAEFRYPTGPAEAGLFHHLARGGEWAVLVPRADVLVHLAGNGDRLRVVRLHLPKRLAEVGGLAVASQPPPGFTPGVPFRYPVRVAGKGNARVLVASGPDGMTAGEDGMISWDPPAGFAEALVPVVLRVAAGDRSLWHEFVLERGPGRPVPESDPRPSGRANYRLPPLPPPVPLEPTRVAAQSDYPLPGVAARVFPGGGGRFLLLYFPTLRLVGVFDTAAAELVRFVRLPERPEPPPADPGAIGGPHQPRLPLLAAGMSKLVAYFPASRTLRRYDLLTGKQEAEKRVWGAEPWAVAVGHASAGPVVVATGRGGRLFDLDTLDEMDPPGYGADAAWPLARGLAAGVLGTRPTDWVPWGWPRAPGLGDSRVAAAANGRAFLSLGVRPTAVWLTGGRVWQHPVSAEQDYAAVGPDGRHVFTRGRGGRALDDRPTREFVYSAPPAFPAAPYSFLPAVAGPYYYRDHRDDEPRAGGHRRLDRDPAGWVTVYRHGLNEPLARVNAPAGRDGSSWLPPGEQVHVVPEAKLAVVIRGGDDRLLLVPCDPAGATALLETDALFVASDPPPGWKPGEVFRYPVTARPKDGLTFRLEYGPDGMAVGPDGVVTWPTAGFAGDEATASVRVTDAEGRTATQTFRLVAMER